jgi:hypothetical protein
MIPRPSDRVIPSKTENPGFPDPPFLIILEKLNSP